MGVIDDDGASNPASILVLLIAGLTVFKCMGKLHLLTSTPYTCNRKHPVGEGNNSLSTVPRFKTSRLEMVELKTEQDYLFSLI